MSYNAAIDMWSLGCILAELYTGKKRRTQGFNHILTPCKLSIGTPLFPGEDEQEQLGCIMEILGVPSRYIIEQCSRRRLFFGKQKMNDMDGWMGVLMLFILK